MQRIIDELNVPNDHLALDESLLLAADEGAIGEAVRIWEFREPVVVVGRSTRVDDEIRRPFCESRGIPILRRCSGGASVVGGPGCLMYSIVLSLEPPEDSDQRDFDEYGALRKIDVAHAYVMHRVLRALRNQIADAELQGTCDLTWKNRKCSGNSLRIARRHLLYHGTILYDFDLSLIAECLKEAPRQPAYRQGRDHESFITNVPMDPRKFGVDLFAIFGAAGETSAESFGDRIRQLRHQRYDAKAWNYRH
jgi:lipoate-protein ligase A